MTAAFGDRPASRAETERLTANGEALQADLAAIEERVFHGTIAASLDDELAALRQIAFNILSDENG
jgi:hypothetical protein